MNTRFCTNKKCEQMNPQTEHNFWIGKSNNTWCKWCLGRAAKAWRERNRERVNKLAMESYRRNRPAKLAKLKASYHENKDKHRNAKLRRFGLDVRQYAKMLGAQEGLCAICLREEPALNSKTKQRMSLAVDHCHKTGKVRGLLCSRCNRMLGLAGDKVHILKSAINYLTKERK